MPSTPQTAVAGALAKPLLLIGGLGLVGLFFWKGLPELLAGDGGDTDGETDTSTGGDTGDGGGAIIQAVQKLDVEYSL